MARLVRSRTLIMVNRQVLDELGITAHDPRFVYFFRLMHTFERRKASDLDREELVALWSAAEHARQIDAKSQQLQTALATRRNYGVAANVVYYLGLGDLIKIGTTCNLLGRMETLTVRDLLGVEPGTITEERARHRQFAHLRMHGEWFRPGEELLNHIDSLSREWRTVRESITLVTLSTAAKCAGVDYTTILRWTDKGLVCKYGSRVDQSEVEEYAAKVNTGRGAVA